MLEISVVRRLALLGLVATPVTFAGARVAAALSRWPLWTIKSGTTTVYLTGETPPHRTDWREQTIEDIVPGCDALWTEAGTASRQPIGPLIIRYGVDPKTPLMSLLSEADRVRLGEAAALAHVPMEQLAKLRPWLATYQLEHEYARATAHTGLSANQVLTARANQSGVPVRSEFPAQDDTIAAYGSLSPAADLQFLRFTLDEMLAAPGKVDRENADWASGDLGPATATLVAASKLYPDLYRELFVERNNRWIARIGEMLKLPKPSLIVVGNYHLLGPAGVLALLRQNGLSPRRV
jgi:uncharacterized protein YbaP (TraB family)